MRVFANQRKIQNVVNMKIESGDMLNVYRLVKSLDLHLRGQYDYLKYFRLKNLTPESFTKEHSDLKLAVSKIHHNSNSVSWSFKMALCAAMRHVVFHEERHQWIHKFIYNATPIETWISDPHSLDQDGCFEYRALEGVVVSLSPLYDEEVKSLNRFHDVIHWYLSQETIRPDFFYVVND